MPTTPKHALPYPAATDAVNQGATNFQNLATAVDNAVFVPAGGAAGSYLAKTSAADYAAGWVALAGGFVPAGGAVGQYLAKTGAGDFASGWTSFAGGFVPAGGAAGQVLAKASAADYATSWQTPTTGGGSGGVASGPTLPVAPAANDVFALIPDAAGFPGVRWLFQWNATSGYWDLLGGSPLTSTVATDEVIGTANAFVDTATVGPQITLPKGGDYLVDFFAHVYQPVSVAPNMGAAVKFGAAATVLADGSLCYMTTSAAAGTFHVARTRMLRTGLAAATVCKLQAFNPSRTDGHWAQRALAVIPVRVLP